MWQKVKVLRLKVEVLRLNIEGFYNFYNFEVIKFLRKVDTRLPGKGNSNSRGARPVYSFRGLSGLGPVGCQ